MRYFWPTAILLLFLSSAVSALGLEFPDPDPNVCLLIAVNSKYSNKSRRDEILNTWSSSSALPPNVKVRFVIGQDPEKPLLSPDVISSLNDASTLPPFSHFVPVLDEYRNNILKLLSFMGDILVIDDPSRSADDHADPTACNSFCSQGYTHLLKADDDTYIYLPGLLRSFPPPSLSAYIGQFVVRPPVRLPTHKNYVSPKCYAEEMYPPYAHGGAWLLSMDAVRFLASSHRSSDLRFIRDGENPCSSSASSSSSSSSSLLLPPPCCCDVDDVQLSLWLGSMPLRPSFLHSPGFVGRHACHGQTVVAIFDVENLMAGIHAGASGDRPSIGGPCSFSVLEAALDDYDDDLGHSQDDDFDPLAAANNGAMLRLLLVGELGEGLDDAMGALDRAVRLEDESGESRGGGGSRGRNGRNADFLIPRIEECQQVFLKGDKEAGRNCFEGVKEFVKKGIEAGSRLVQTQTSQTNS